MQGPSCIPWQNPFDCNMSRAGAFGQRAKPRMVGDSPRDFSQSSTMGLPRTQQGMTWLQGQQDPGGGTLVMVGNSWEPLFRGILGGMCPWQPPCFHQGHLH